MLPYQDLFIKSNGISKKVATSPTRCKIRVKRKIHVANLRVSTEQNGLVTCVGPMVGHLRKNQRIAFVVEFDTNKFHGRRVMIRSRIRDFRLKNNIAVVCGDRVLLDDVRFLDSTNRSAKMDLLVQVLNESSSSSESNLVEFVFPKAIKITADGPRNRASKSKKKNNNNGIKLKTSKHTLDASPLTPSESSSSESSSMSSSSCSSPSSPESSSNSYEPHMMYYESRNASPSSHSCDSSTSPLVQHQSPVNYEFNQEIYQNLQHKIFIYECYYQNVKHFEQILNEDNQKREGGQRLPQSSIDEIVQRFAYLLFNQYFP